MNFLWAPARGRSNLEEVEKWPPRGGYSKIKKSLSVTFDQNSTDEDLLYALVLQLLAIERFTYGGTELTLWEIYIAIIDLYISYLKYWLIYISAIEIITQLLRYIRVNYWEKIYISQYLRYIFLKASVRYHRIHLNMIWIILTKKQN